ncbi:exodeoxyribonuclease VII large subunit [Candidatus Uhrbacteria bacterium]|nr:exodeoxyribonuclease VII large subunit [Candidatus Uhrbacteria bacterium]
MHPFEQEKGSEGMRVMRVAAYLSLLNDALRVLPSEEIAVEGEVSDFRIAQSKWVSFDLKDEEAEAVLKCFMTVWQLAVPVEDGLRVRVHGCPKVYERFGTLKFNVTRIELVGEGALRRAYELLKRRLEKEGFFDASRKRPLPRFPERIGLITSRDAAAYGDFLRILNDRWGGLEVDFTHVHVQGREAVPEILGAFAHFNALSAPERPDALVLIRGGGGLEDLHAFNDERVARAVFQSKIPVVCGVGHERDESLCDFVADVRASTPSNAAERLVPRRDDVGFEVGMLCRHMEERLSEEVDRRRRLIERTAAMMAFVLDRQKRRLETLSQWFSARTETWVPRLRERLDAHERVLKNVDPKRILSRGYGIVTARGRLVRDASALEGGQEVAVQLGQGTFDAEVLRINGKGRQKLI